MAAEAFKRMRLKDPGLADKVGAHVVSVAIAKWRENYPEDFATLKATDHPSVLNTKAEEFIILHSNTPKPKGE